MISGAAAEQNFASAKTPAEVDIAMRAMLAGGDVPDYIATHSWKWLEIVGGGHTLRILVAPDYLAFGGTPFRAGRSTPFGAQDAADAFDAILPSRKIVREIQRAASPRIRFLDPKGPPFNVPLSQIETQRALVAANEMANAAFADRGIHPGEGLPIGYRKAIVVGPDLDGSRVAIFGGIGTNLDKVSGRNDIVQGYSTLHGIGYSDYSHGIVLVSRKAELDGRRVDLRSEVFGSSDPSVVALVNDHGTTFDPVFPNAGPRSRATFGGHSVPIAPGGASTKPPSTPPKTPPASSRSSSTSLAGAGAGLFALLALGWWLLS